MSHQSISLSESISADITSVRTLALVTKARKNKVITLLLALFTVVAYSAEFKNFLLFEVKSYELRREIRFPLKLLQREKYFAPLFRREQSYSFINI